jgi:very-short-patch-repair endonuclease
MSTYEIAVECDTYPNKVRRLLLKYKIPLRDKSTAQANALKQGRHTHPTKGIKHPESVKVKISESMGRLWQAMPPAERDRRIAMAKQQWEDMTVDEREQFKRLATDAVRVAAVEGSKLEKYLLHELRKQGYEIKFHAENVVANEDLQIDLFLPTMKVAIEIDGPAHFYPIWGEENLAKHLVSDNEKTGLIIQAGYVMIRIKHLVKSTSKMQERKLLATLISELNKIDKEFPPAEKRLIEIEVK